jgi:formate hydrogenlyase subunit 6/NADH:ubiquinone oxidoreductase subunit I
MAYLEIAKLVFKWAFKKPATSQYPAEARKPVEGSRGQLDLADDSCVFCTACAKKCPTGAIVVDRANKTFQIERLRCISCGYCVEICPKHSLELNTDHATPSIAHDKEMLRSTVLNQGQTPPESKLKVVPAKEQT